jgi:hypothetical protein
MDKFDQTTKQAKQDHEPNNNFVEETMQQISGGPSHKHWSIKFWAPALTGAVALIAIISVVLLGSSHSKMSTTSQPSTTVAQAKQQPATSGSDNASLTSDLNGINNSQSQENNDQNSANSALNDSSQQISVPTD